MLTTAKVVDTIRDCGPMGQADLASKLSVERSTISRAVARLTRNGLIRPCGERPATRNGGRKTILLELNPDGASAIGVDLNIRTTVVAHVNLAGQMLWKQEFKTPDAGTPETILPFLVEAVATALQQTGIAEKGLAGIGVGIPGHIDSRNGIALSAVNFDPTWRNVHVAAALQSQFFHPIVVDNDGRMSTLAEQWYGEGRGIDDFCMFHVGYGLGMAAVINGQFFRGANGHACDVHMVVDPDGPLCRCGRRGCIEAIVGGRTFAEHPDAETAKYAARMLGITIANLVDVFDPSKVLMAGRLLDQCPNFHSTVDAAYHEYTISSRSTPEPDLVRSRFGDDGIVIGAGLAAMEKRLGMEYSQ